MYKHLSSHEAKERRAAFTLSKQDVCMYNRKIVMCGKGRRMTTHSGKCGGTNWWGRTVAMAALGYSLPGIQKSNTENVTN
jgi:hypothetical protein